MHFKLITDCNSLKLTLEKKDVNLRILRWSLILHNYDFDLEHKKAERMKHVDALNRCIMVLEGTNFEDTLCILQEKDEDILNIKNQLFNSEDAFYE